MKHLKPELKALFAKEKFDKDVTTITSGTSQEQLLKFVAYFSNPYTIRFLALCEMVRNDRFKFSLCAKWLKNDKRDAISLEDYTTVWKGSLFRIEKDAIYTNQEVADYFKEMDEIYKNLPKEYTTDASQPIWQHMTKVGQYFINQTNYVYQQFCQCDKNDVKESMSWMEEFIREMQIVEDIMKNN